LSRTARLAAATPNRAARLMTLRFLRSNEGMNGVTSKSDTSPAMCTGKDDVSKQRMGPTPLRPSTQADQKASFPTPLGATTPTPETATLRMAALHRRRRPARSCCHRIDSAICVVIVQRPRHVVGRHHLLAGTCRSRSLWGSGQAQDLLHSGERASISDCLA